MHKEILQQANILLVDDEIEHFEGLSRLLREDGYWNLKHAMASCGAFRLDGEFQPDLIILDMPIPDNSGCQMLEQLRNAIPKETYLPILVVTGSASVDVRREALARGATAFLTKPYDPAEVVLLVRNLLETRFLHLQLANEHGELGTRIKDLTGITSALQAEVAKRERVEAELRQSKALPRGMLDNSPSVIFFKETQGRYLDVNPRFEQLFGLKRDQIIGRTDSEIFPEEQAAIFRANDLRVIESGTPLEFEEVAQYTDGPHLSIVSKFPLRDANGKVSVICGIVTDITERSQMVEALQQSEEALQKANDELDIRVRERTAQLMISNEQLRAEGAERRETEEALRKSNARCQRIAANVPGMVYQFMRRPDGSVSFPFVSAGCRELFDLGPAEIESDAHLLGNLLHPNDRELFVRSMDESAANLQPWEWQGRFHLRSGREKWVQGAARPERLTNGDILWDGLLMDITERKRIEESAHQAKEEAERANAAKSEFLSRMSHELRTPLNSILGFGQLLKMDAHSSEQEDNIDRVLAAGHHLLKLIDEVLDISRIEASNLTLSIEPVLLSDAVRGAVDLVHSMAVTRNVQIGELTCDRYILADQQRLRQILLNLLSNAVKYNRSGGSVALSVTESPCGMLRLMIRDSGLGIAPEDTTKLFNPFERLRAADSKIEGIGLGLAISRRLIELMGGEIGVESEPNEGSTFWIELPLAESHVEQSEPAPAAVIVESAVPGKSGTLLCIEDNLSNLKLIERALARRPAFKSLATMHSGLGLEMAREHRPDLIILDLHLPDINGDVLLEELRADSDTAGIPVVIISADATPAQTERLLAAGAREYLTKPLNISKFLALVDETLK
jgi:PAS domain S-box-containing protein